MAMAEPAIAGRRNRVIKPPTPEPEPDLMGSPAVSGALVGLAFKLPLSALSFFIVWVCRAIGPSPLPRE
ncbi:unnamed protein product [Prorocentrum cordatum]|uniref:Uncharacterized protein n=1 Tax=Prorocentrum cordatum TaxID=2364126 RepID=A0ABN9WRK1_9DINO|nr:unnamed protein product [Polarella glacialis]